MLTVQYVCYAPLISVCNVIGAIATSRVHQGMFIAAQNILQEILDLCQQPGYEAFRDALINNPEGDCQDYQIVVTGGLAWWFCVGCA